jgi:hypothetical protein
MADSVLNRLLATSAAEEATLEASDTAQACQRASQAAYFPSARLLGSGPAATAATNGDVGDGMSSLIDALREANTTRDPDAGKVFGRGVRSANVSAQSISAAGLSDGRRGGSAPAAAGAIRGRAEVIVAAPPSGKGGSEAPRLAGKRKRVGGSAGGEVRGEAAHKKQALSSSSREGSCRKAMVQPFSITCASEEAPSAPGVNMLVTAPPQECRIPTRGRDRSSP